LRGGNLAARNICTFLGGQSQLKQSLEGYERAYPALATTNVSGLFLASKGFWECRAGCEVLYWRHAKAARASHAILVEATRSKAGELQQDFYQQS